MRKSLFGAGSAPRGGTLRSRNTSPRGGTLRPRTLNVETTPQNRQNGESVRKSYLSQTDNGNRGNTRQQVNTKRISAEGISRISLTGGSRYTPTRPSTAANNNLQPNSNRLSMESVRSSSMGGRSVQKETRSLSDPKFKSSCIDKIMNFMKLNNYDTHITRRNLLTPTTKDFINIFNFIYRHLDGSYQLPAKFEDEIPKLLKNFKYPVQITKSSFITVGSPHTWPAVLAMLAWLVDVVEIYCSLEPVSQAFPEDFVIELNQPKVKFYAMVKCCQNITKKDVVGQELDKYRNILEEYEQVRPQDILKIQEEEDSLDQELKNLAIGPELLQKLQHQHQQIIDDKDKLEAYCVDLQTIISKKDAKVSALAAELSQHKEESKEINREIHRLTQLQEEQGLNAVELIRFKNHAADGAALITQLQSEGKELDSQIWSLEMELSKAQKTLQESVHNYNISVQQMELGATFKVSAVGVAESLPNWENDILPSLRSIKKSTKQSVFQVQTNAQSVKEEKCTIFEMLQDKRDNLKKFELKLNRLEDNLTNDKSQIKQEEQGLREECEKLQILITEGKLMHKGYLYQKKCALDKSKDELQAVKSRGSDRMKDGADFLVNVCNSSLEHSEFVSRESIKCKLTVESLVEEMRKLD